MAPVVYMNKSIPPPVPYPPSSFNASPVKLSHYSKFIDDRALSEGPSNPNDGPFENEFSEDERDLIPGETILLDFYKPILRARIALATAHSPGLSHR